MLGDIHDRLMQAKERLRSKRKLTAMLCEAQATLDEDQRKCGQYEQRLATEKADVERLEGIGLTGRFNTVLGTKDERLEQERQEYLAVKLKYDECTQAVEDARQEVERLQKEISACGDAEDEYNRLIEEKRQLLSQTGDERAEKLMDLSERLADLEADRKELGEAVRAGEEAQNALEQVRSELQSAQNWGTWDMIGGGTLTRWRNTHGSTRPNSRPRSPSAICENSEKNWPMPTNGCMYRSGRLAGFRPLPIISSTA